MSCARWNSGSLDSGIFAFLSICFTKRRKELFVRFQFQDQTNVMNVI